MENQAAKGGVTQAPVFACRTVDSDRRQLAAVPVAVRLYRYPQQQPEKSPLYLSYR